MPSHQPTRTRSLMTIAPSSNTIKQTPFIRTGASMAASANESANESADANAPAGTTAPVKPKGGIAGFFSKQKSETVADKLKIFQHMRSVGKLSRNKEKTENTHADDDQTSTAGAPKEQQGISALVDLEQQAQPDWNPLFGSEVGESEGGDSKGKGKEREIPPAVPSVPPDLPNAHQILADQQIRSCPLYNYTNLYTGFPVLELWDVEGDTLVYLRGRNSTDPRGPSFFVKSSTLLDTADYWTAALSSTWQSGIDIDKAKYPTAKFALFFAPDKPVDKAEETDPLALLRHYITMRNVFACVFDSFGVGLRESDSPLLNDFIDRMLMYFEGSEGMGQKLSSFIKKSGLWDVSNDPVKAVDLLNLANAYETEDLYVEAFAHCVGMWPQIKECNAQHVLPKAITNLLETRHKEFTTKINEIAKAFKKFEFPRFWHHKSPAAKLPIGVRHGFEAMREFMSSYYSSSSQSWPPENLETRAVLMKIYGDTCSLYSLLMDRQYNSQNACANYKSLIPWVAALFYFDMEVSEHGEHIPYGVPLLPGYFAQAQPGGRRREKFKHDMNKNLTIDALDPILRSLYNDEGMRGMNAGVTEIIGDGDIASAFMGFEKSMMIGKTLKEIAEARKGMWTLIYCILSLMAEVVVETFVTYKADADYFVSVDTRGICLWKNEERQKKQNQPVAAANGGAVGDNPLATWSVASLNGGGNADENAEEDSGGEDAQAGASTSQEAAVVTIPTPTLCEMSYPWLVAQATSSTVLGGSLMG